MRKRIPRASAAVFIIASSVGSSVRTTRASRSSMARASRCSGPLTTMSGRGSLGIRSSPFGLLAGDDDQVAGVEGEGRAVQAAEDVHAAPALGAEHRPQLVRRVQPDVAL